MTAQDKSHRCYNCAEYKKAAGTWEMDKSGQIVTIRCPLKGVNVQPLCFCNEWGGE